MPLQWLKDFVLPALTFLVGVLGGFFFPHVQRPLTDYRTTLRDISHTLVRNIIVIYSSYDEKPRVTTRQEGEQQEKVNQQLRDLYSTFRDLHARLLSSTSTIPKLSMPVLRCLRLVQSRQEIQEGAGMLIGISNQIVQRNKDGPHLTTLVKRLGVALHIDVGQ